jgi:primosomal protein N' (replication factor Y)
MSPIYCEVALPTPLRRVFTYLVPERFRDDELVGRRVVVPFRTRSLVGVVLAFTHAPAEVEKIREISDVLDDSSALTPALIELGRWVSRYYVAPIGEVFRALLPPVIDVQKTREYLLTDLGRKRLALGWAAPSIGPTDASGKDKADDRVLESFARDKDGAFSEKQLAKIQDGLKAAERLHRAGLLGAREISIQHKPRVQKIAAWNSSISGEEIGHAADPITRSSNTRVNGDGAGGNRSDAEAVKIHVREILERTHGPLPFASLRKIAGVSLKVLERLEKQGFLSTWEEPVASAEDSWDTDYVPPRNVLNAEQRAVLGEIWSWLSKGEFTTALLYGVTGSGKTEVYLATMEAALAQGRTALLLVPEIALTLWMSRQVRARFGPVVAVLHSGLGDAERAREWWRVRRGEALVVVGTRSAVFAPLIRPGLIIVDEEQESSYKQEETPRYHGRDTAIYRARMESAVALLGSATPSLETYHHARAGKYHLLELRSRVENRPMAAVRIVDLRDEFRGTGESAPVSRELRTALESTLAAGTQSLVLINRRGYSWFLLCRSCGSTVECEDCSISLTYHKKRARLECHYCGYQRRAPTECPKCQSKYLYFVGDGAERVEEYLREQLPQARIGRLDRDTVRTKRDFQQVLGSFASGQLDILVGTQMLAKGHDFERVTLVGVLAADVALGRPDFRAAERTFHLLTQVAGRAGRGNLPGEVLVETYHPDHYAIQEAVRQDYPAFYEKEAHFRRMLHYPPFTALASVLVRDKKLERVVKWSHTLARYFQPLEKGGLRVLGPAVAPLARLKTEYRYQFLLKSPRRAPLIQALAGCMEFCAEKEIPESAIQVDVDPVHLF